MTATVTPHTLIVGPCQNCHPRGNPCTCWLDDVTPDCTLEITCPGISDYCQTWWECTHPRCVVITDEDEEARDCDGELHGVEHRPMSFGWGVRGIGDCYAKTYDERWTAVLEAFDERKRRLEPGRYLFEIETDDEWCYFHLLTVTS